MAQLVRQEVENDDRRHQDDESILNIGDLERAASQKMPKIVRDYYNSGATYETTYRANTSAFDKYMLRPRVLVDVSQVDTSTELFGRRIPFPLGISPTALHRLAHPDGEIATARACKNLGITMGLSSYSSSPWGECVREGGGTDFVAQMYIYPDRALVRNLTQKAESLGCKAIFLTADAPILGTRWNETRNRMVESLRERLSFPNLTQAALDADLPTEDVAHLYQDDSQNWHRDIPFLRSLTKMKILIKGVLTAEDTLCAIELGVDGIIVSNHGGRQLDGVPASLDALVECVDAARGRIPIYVDGGFRKGSDIIKALALGADCVWVGRPALWGLANGGQKGVELMLHLFHEEFKKAMQLMGCQSIKDITRDRLAILDSSGFLKRLDQLDWR